jgi:hypothetical protein
VQQAVLQALMALAATKPAVMKQEVGKVYDTFRSQALLDQVLQCCPQL